MLGLIDKECHVFMFSIFAMKPSFVGHFGVRAWMGYIGWRILAIVYVD